MKQLELLAPAKNCEQGMAAVCHGADAVYIGAPLFGARAAAGNTVEEIDTLVRYAHLYGAKVFATVNTLLFDEELEEAARMIRALYNVGVDALIIQDLGLLEMDLPPIELHASTQMHNLDIRRVKFLEQVGFRRIILPRELSLQQMAEMRAGCHADLEAFVQGALCVCYSGQCYLSQYLNGRSGNRGTCSQPCRSSYDLYNDKGQLLQRNRHLLSLKDFSAASHIAEMAACGITSFKIEGRLKDLSYVKNTTAYYRLLIDSVMEQHAKGHDAPSDGKKYDKETWRAASSGTCRFFFVPDLERTFNRDFTDYFLVRRQQLATLITQKARGKIIGPVTSICRGSVTIRSNETLSPGDGLFFINNKSEVVGLQVNHVSGNTFVPNHLQGLTPRKILCRNYDYAFEKLLQGKTAERKIAVDMALEESPKGLILRITDEENIACEAHMDCPKESALHPEKANEQMRRQLGKLGDTVFVLRELQLPIRSLILPAAVLNELRRLAVALLTEKRIAAHHPDDVLTPANDVPYYDDTVDYRCNIVNKKAAAFYNHHGVREIEYGLEKTGDYTGKLLMTTKYCLRYEMGICLKMKNNFSIAPAFERNLLLRNNQHLFRLSFDCKRCEMHVQACEETAAAMLQRTGHSLEDSQIDPFE